MLKRWAYAKLALKMGIPGWIVVLGAGLKSPRFSIVKVSKYGL